MSPALRTSRIHEECSTTGSANLEPITPASGKLSGGARIALAIALAILLFFLLAEHRAHFFGALPYLLLISCPLLHLFMHRGHGGHGAHGQDGSPSQAGDAAAPTEPRR